MLYGCAVLNGSDVEGFACNSLLLAGADEIAALWDGS